MQLTLDVSHCCLNKYVDPVEYRSNHVNLKQNNNKIYKQYKHTNAKRTSQILISIIIRQIVRLLVNKYVFLAKVHNYLKKKIIVLEFIPVKPDIWNKIFFFLIEQFIETLEIYSWKSSLFF